MSSRHRFGIQRFLNVRGAASPSFSPDGTHLAFVSAISGVPQVWGVAAGGGWPEQATFETERVSFVEYSPTAPQLVYGIDRGGDERTQLRLLSDGGASDAALTDQPSVIHNFGGWSPDGKRIAYSSNERHPAFFDVYVRELATGETRCIFRDDGTNHAAAWAPDGRSLVVSHVHTGFVNDLFLVDVESSVRRQLTLSQPPAHYVSLNWRPDGSGFYAVTDLGRDKPALCRYELATGEFTVIEAPEREVERAKLSDDGSKLAYCVNEDGYSRLIVLSLSHQERNELPALAPGVISELEWAPDSRRLAFVYASSMQNPDVFIWDTDASSRTTPQQLTHSSRAGLPREAFVEPELVQWPAHDGLTVPGFWYAPADASGPLPTVIHVHGGPEGQARPTYNPVIAYLVNRGFGVLAPNVRGSTGYGNRYRSLDDLELRMDSVTDLKSAVEWLISTGRSDAGRIAVMGGSYGGFMTLAALTTYPELWAAGVDIVGIANWVTFMQHTGPWRRKLREAEYGSLDGHRDLLERLSPLHKADQIRAPLIVIHGANDPRVPIGEAEQIVAAVRDHEVPCEYLRFEDEGHGLIKLNNRIAGYTAIADFLERQLAP